MTAMNHRDQPAATPAPFPPLAVAEAIADELLFPTALATDASDLVPRGHLDALAAAGLYGPPADPATGLAVIEALAGGCLSTTFVWLQHQAALREVAGSAAREAWWDDLSGGKWRAGIAVAGIRPGAVGLTARSVAGGWLVNGDVPWVTGWGRVDVLLTAARAPGGEILWALIDAVESPTLAVERLRMAALQATGTVAAHFREHFVAEPRATGVERYEDWAERDARGLGANGSLALGVARRCCRLLGPGRLDDDLAACRDELDRAALTEPAALPEARAAAALLAVRAAAAVVASSGSRSVLLDQHPQRLAREAMFLLAFGSRLAIRTVLRQRLEGAF